MSPVSPKAIKATSPEAVVNRSQQPLDAIGCNKCEWTGFDPMPGDRSTDVLDTHRYRAVLARNSAVSARHQALLDGGHGGHTMVPIPSCTSVGGYPRDPAHQTARTDDDRRSRTRKGGAENRRDLL